MTNEHLKCASPTQHVRSIGITLVLLLLCALSLKAAFADSAQYFYDAGGRLTGVLDPVNGTAQYNYDKSGNITSIQRDSLTTLTVLSVSPNPVAVGGAVTIRGTAFGTIANTSASFNGTVATPSAVTSTSLTVTVPTGASTGIVSVTAPGGTVSFPVPITIGLVSAPTISSFTTGTSTPTTAAIGDTLTISGTNFDTTFSKVLVNGQFAPVTSATTTSITISVPQAGSGKVEVDTPAGKATSSADLIVAPAGFSVAQITATARTTIGASPITIAEGGSSTVSMALFDATAGQKINPYSYNHSVAGCPTMALLLPSGIPAFPPTTPCSNDVYFGPWIAPQTGTYQILLAAGNPPGSFQAQVYLVPPDPTASLTVGGSAGSITLGTPGQNGTFTFAGTAGQRISVYLDMHSMSSCYVTYAVTAPDGSYLISPITTCSDAAWAADPYVLPQSGTYTISLVPTVGNIGTISGKVYNVPADPTAVLTIGGSTQTISLTTPGQHGSFTFSGTTGQRVALNLDLHAMDVPTVYTVTNPDTSVLFGPTSTFSNHLYVGGSAFVLGQTGTYTVSLVPTLTGYDPVGVGNYSATALSVPPDVTAAVTVGGSMVYQTISAPGQLATFTFSGTSGSSYTTTFDFSGIPTCSYYAINNPDGSALVSPNLTCSNSPSTGSIPVAQSGTFTIIITPFLGSGGLTDGTGPVGAKVTSP